jgi:hypothetical protein
MADAMEIAPNDTIPALPPLPGASPLVHIPRVGDGQTWPLASAGIAVAVAAITRRPDNYSDFFLVILTFAGLMPRVLRYSSATPSPPPPPTSPRQIYRWERPRGVGIGDIIYRAARRPSLRCCIVVVARRRGRDVHQ